MCGCGCQRRRRASRRRSSCTCSTARSQPQNAPSAVCWRTTRRRRESSACRELLIMLCGCVNAGVAEHQIAVLLLDCVCCGVLQQSCVHSMDMPMRFMAALPQLQCAGAAAAIHVRAEVHPVGQTQQAALSWNNLRPNADLGWPDMNGDQHCFFANESQHCCTNSHSGVSVILVEAILSHPKLRHHGTHCA